MSIGMFCAPHKICLFNRFEGTDQVSYAQYQAWSSTRNCARGGLVDAEISISAWISAARVLKSAPAQQKRRKFKIGRLDLRAKFAAEQFLPWPSIKAPDSRVSRRPGNTNPREESVRICQDIRDSRPHSCWNQGGDPYQKSDSQACATEQFKFCWSSIRDV